MPEIRLEQKLSLKQVLTPQLIQSLQLLQIPKLELATELRAEIEQNPMLEILEDGIEDVRDEEEKLPEEEEEMTLDEELEDWDRFTEGLSLCGSQLPENDPDEEEIDPYFGASGEKTLYRHLLDQLAVATDDDRLYDLGEFIVGNLDERGFLNMDDEELLGAAREVELLDPPPTEEEISRALELVQRLDPPGIAASNLRESFLIQLRLKGKEESLAWRLVEDHFDMIKSKNRPQLADIAGATVPEIDDAMKVLGTLNFSPASDLTGQAGGRIDPDLVVEKVQGRWVVRYNGAGIPELRISRYYRKLLKKRGNLDRDTKKFLSKKFNSAQWWIKALQQRRDTMVRTMRAILHHQFAFFEQGPGNLMPLKMEEIAEEVDVHPATISRVVRDKYVQTPYGVFALRHFFGGGLETETGEDIATSNVKSRIRGIIEEEDKAKPLADQKITNRLNESGIKIARRTVAKYREEMGIPTARMRKRKRS